jgi:hypothetical protein
MLPLCHDFHVFFHDGWNFNVGAVGEAAILASGDLENGG